MNKKQIAAMTDDEVLAAVGPCGPGIVGQDLFDRAQRIAKRNPAGIYGPGIVGDTNEEDPPKPDKRTVDKGTGTGAAKVPSREAKPSNVAPKKKPEA